ncbi:ribonuclease H-like domain, reverse transcriptase, RNA-dependent DNA polymerase, partial [Tanacetum coccineum]
DKDELHDEDDATEESHDGSSLKENGTADQQVYTAIPDINTGSREVSTALPESHTATPEDLVGPSLSSVQTRRMKTSYSKKGFLSAIYEGKTHQDLHTCLFVCFLSQEEPKRVSQALRDPTWVEAMQEELLQFKLQKVWILVDLPKGHRAIGTKWVYRNKKDERGIIIRNKARLVAQGHTQEEGIDYDEVFTPVARIKAIRLFLAYASYMGFMVYQMDVKSAFLYGQIEDEVQQNKKGIFISQDKYVHEILRKFNYSDVKSASTPTDLEKPLVQDGDADDVDEHLYRSMIGSLMYLTASRPDIMFAVCACARFQVSPKSSHLLAVKRIFRYLKGKPSLGLWYSKDSPLELVAYTDSDYAGATQDRKSTTGGCQFLGNRLISWQCKKQTVVATSTTEAEYVAAASCCGQISVLGLKYWNAQSLMPKSLVCFVKFVKLSVSTAKQEKWRNVVCSSSVGFHTTQQMVISSPCLIDNKELTSPEQTAPGKDFSNPLIVDSLLKTIWSSMHHVFTMKHWLVQSKRLLVKTNQIR